MADYQDLTTRYTYRKILTWGDLADLAENDIWLKENGWQDSTKGIFFQAAAPIGWTQDTSQNNKLLRVTTGVGGGAGGSQAPTTAVTLAHTHTVPTEGAHTHATLSHTHSAGLGAASFSSIGVVAIGQGDVDVDFFQTGLTNPGDKMVQTTTTHYDADNSTSDGSHTHALASSLSNISIAYCDVIIATKDTSSGFIDVSALFEHDAKVDYEPFDDFAGNDLFNLARLTPDGTIMPFFQTVAPQGWTKETGTSGKALRVVSGSGGGTGGSFDISGAITLAHTHTLTAAGAHTHTMGAHRHDQAVLASLLAATYTNPIKYAAWDAGTGFWEAVEAAGVSRTIMKARTKKDGAVLTATGGGPNGGDDHQHTVDSSLSNVTLAYCDVIHCSKDSGGAPFPFEDMTGVAGFKKLVSKQKLTRFAQVDEHLYFHTVPSGSRAYFFQALAPAHWTKVTEQDDKALRVTSGAGGSSAGSVLMSAGIVLAHTHVIQNHTHSHTPSGSGHRHERDTRVEANAGPNSALAGGRILGIQTPVTATSQVLVGSSSGSGFPLTQYTAYSNFGTDQFTHSHTGATQSSLSNVVFSYIDVILCQKD